VVAESRETQNTARGVSRHTSGFVDLHRYPGCGSSGEMIAMMKATEPWHGDDFASRSGIFLGFTTGRRFLLQCEMCSVALVVTDVFIHQALQMSIIENDHMVEQIAAAVAHPSLGNTVLPRTSEAGSRRLGPEAPYGIDHLRVEAGVPVKNQVARSSVVRERFAQLLNHPGAGRVPGHIAVEDAPAIMRNDKEAVENAESQRWHSKEIHCCNGFPMIAQKRRCASQKFHLDGMRVIFSS
jgi:hypothetical protein